MPQNPRVDAYIERQAGFAKPILTWYRARMHAACPEIEEEIKWGMPCFYLKGRPVANMAAFKAHATFGFWNRGEMATGKEGEAMGQHGRVTSMADLPDAAALEADIRKAVTLLAEGNVPKRAARPARPEAEVPAALAAALAQDEAAAATFNGFPPGQRREYCDWIAEAKRDETRAKRVADAIQWLREGKRRNWKYENC